MAPIETKTELKVVLGTMNMGKEGIPLTRVHDLKDCTAIVDVFQKHGHNEIDTARLYGFGSTEEYLAQMKWQERGLVVGTKLSPKKFGPKPYSHKPADLERGVLASKQALQTEQLDLFYLHLPDRETAYEETLQGVTDLYNAGHFKRFGLCNFPAWEVARICELCDRHGFKKPDVYQASYNAFHRSCEAELVPCLRRYGIAFYVFSPLAGGMLSDRYSRDGESSSDSQEEGVGGVVGGGRFDAGPGAAGPDGKGSYYRKQYWHEPSFAALDVIRPVAKKHGMSTAEAALRWNSHRSLLRRECGDTLVIGASRPEQLEKNLESLEKGPLPEEVVRAFDDDAWAIVKATAVPYFA